MKHKLQQWQPTELYFRPLDWNMCNMQIGDIKKCLIIETLNYNIISFKICKVNVNEM